MHRLKTTGLCALVLLGAGAVATAQAQEPAKPAPPPSLPTSPAEVPAPGAEGSLSLDPTTPQVAALPGGVTPAYGQKSQSEGDWRFDFHGFLTAPLVVGIGSRSMPTPDQSGTTLHTPPAVPDDLETFSHTGVVPTTYAQLNFSQGTSLVSAHMSILARQANASTSFLEPASQLGVTDLYVSILPKLERARTEVFVGAFTSRYGSPGEYDEGRYGTPLIARINGVGQRASVRAPFGGWTLMAEEGIAGQSNKANASTTPDVWNDFANPSEGTSFVAHGHLGARYRTLATLGLHLIHAWGQDDRGNNNVVAAPGTSPSQPDARMGIYAADLRVTAGRFGHLYLAGSYTDASNVTTLSRIVSVLNTRGGPGLIANYLGPNSGGNGNLTTIGGQFDLSIGKLISYPVPFSGDGPDLFVSVFGMLTHVNSDDKQFDRNGRYYDGVTKRKLGAELTYSFLSWLAVSGRYDRVDPDTQDLTYSFSVVSPRVILRTDWLATDQIVLQYSHWFNGANTLIRVGDPPMENIAWLPDKDMVSLSASMWW